MSSKRNLFDLLLLACTWLFACRPAEEPTTRFPVPTPTPPHGVDVAVDSADYADRVLGALVGSAIGDAMGAPVEMWHRAQIVARYGYIHTLLPVLRERSAEGPWAGYLPLGATTDDTRWKYLFTDYAVRYPQEWPQPARLAAYIQELYQAEFGDLQRLPTSDVTSLERELTHLAWLQEWARVAEAYLSGNIDHYVQAVNRFYGGEMSCAGLLYAPMVGLLRPGQPDLAYRTAYDLALFDIGYARDLTALSAAYTAAAMVPGVAFERPFAVHSEVDPLGYFDSRLLGRFGYRIYEKALLIARSAHAVGQVDTTIRVPDEFRGTALEYTRRSQAYRHLEEAQQEIAFHAGEIYLIALTGLQYGRGDFAVTMEFITNFGRDNDTAAALAGFMLGAQLGFRALPATLAQPVIQANRERLGIDLETLAERLVGSSE